MDNPFSDFDEVMANYVVTPEQLRKEGMVLDENGKDTTGAYYGKKHSAETKALIAAIDRKGENNPMYGKKRPDISEYNRTRVNPNTGKTWKHPPGTMARSWATRRAKYGPTGTANYAGKPTRKRDNTQLDFAEEI